MQITLSFTGERDQVVLQLREGATQADLEQREFENVLRGALLDYLEENAAPGNVSVSVGVTLNYTPAESVG